MANRRPSLAAALTAALVAIMLAPAGALAQANESVGAKRDWSIFKQGAGAERQCWVVSQPVTSTATRAGNPVSVRRGDIFLMVAIRPGEQVKNEVSMLAGYPFKKGAAATMKIGATTFEMFTEGEGAWTDSPETDAKVVAALKRGANAVVSGRSTRGTKTSDTFSLLGFTAALNEATALCK